MVSPATIFASRLISGAEARAADLPNVVTATRTLVLESADQVLVFAFRCTSDSDSRPAQSTRHNELVAPCTVSGRRDLQILFVFCSMQCPCLGDDHGPQYNSVIFLPTPPSKASFQLCSARQCGSENFQPKPVMMQPPALMILPMLIGSLLTRVLPVTVN